MSSRGKGLGRARSLATTNGFGAPPRGQTRPEEDEVSELRKQLVEQNQIFWESARRKDDDIERLQRECAALAEELSAKESSEGQESAEKQEARARDAEQNLSKTREELRASRRDAGERVKRHAEDMQALSDALCSANNRYRDSDVALEASCREVELLTIQLAEYSRDPFEELSSAREETQLLAERLSEGAEEAAMWEVRLQAALAAEGRTEAAVEEGRSRLENASAVNAELEAEVSASLDRHAAEARAEASEASVATMFQSHAAELEKALALIREDVTRARHEQKLEEDAAAAARKATESALDDVKAAKARADRLVARLEEEKEELRNERCHRESGERVAQGAALMLEEAQKRAAEADERTVKAERLFFAEQLSAKRDEAAAVEAESKKARRALGEEVIAEAAFKRASNEAEQRQEHLKQECSRLTEELTRWKGDCETALKSAEDSWLHLRSLEEATQLEMQVARRHRAAMLTSEEEAAEKFFNELQASTLSTEAAAALAEERSAELFEEEAVQASLKKQVTSSKSQISKLQEDARWQQEIHEERAAELATVKADATRHARFNTELRAELADTKRELSKCRHAARSLTQVSDELEATLMKLSKAQRGGGALEAELEAARQKQANLERQLRDCQAKLADSRAPDERQAFAWLSAPSNSCAQTMAAPSNNGSASFEAAINPCFATQGPSRSASTAALPSSALRGLNSSSERIDLSEPAEAVGSPGSSRGMEMGRSLSHGALGSAQDAILGSDAENGRPPYPPLGPLQTTQGSFTRPPPPPGARQVWASSSLRRSSGSSSEAPSPSSRKGSRSPLNRSGEVLGMSAEVANAIDKVVR